MKHQSRRNSQEIQELSCDDKNFDGFVSQLKAVDSKEFLNQYILSRPRSRTTYRIDSYCVSVYENSENYEKALKVAEELLNVQLESVLIRTFFRICRKIGNYEKIDALLNQYPAILKRTDFHTLYELVYYFEAYDKLSEVKNTLKKIEGNYPDNDPIRATVRNFYLKFGFLEDANKVKKTGESRIYATVEKEYEDMLEAAAAQESQDEMISQMLAHEKHLIAISDLAKGISHEFGQPITNIRYTVQRFRYFFKGEITKEILFSEIFDRILKETERMGRLNDRLSPITSSKSFIEEFDVTERIQEVVKALALRLVESQIKVDIQPIKPIFVTIDPVKFDQIINNLLLNAIDAIEEKKSSKINESGINEIDINIKDKKNCIRIVFKDSGKGIPPEYREKIFEPFFTRKDPGKGEGLGLFIVWNILKMYGGKIMLDTEHEQGTRFFITIPKKTVTTKARIKLVDTIYLMSHK